MGIDLEFFRPGEKPALTGMGSPELLGPTLQALQDLGYALHATPTQEDFMDRFSRFPYQVAIYEETLPSVGPEPAGVLAMIQRMPMAQRRHATIFLIGSQFQSMNPMQAFQQSVHCVIHPDDIGQIKAIIQQIVSDNDSFLATYRDTLTRLKSRGR